MPTTSVGATPLDPITAMDASELSAAIHARQLSCRDVMQAYLRRIDAVNPRFNAIVSRAPEDALLAQADQCDQELAAGQSRGWMHGMPQAIKDTGHAVGFPTTFGCALLKDAVASTDSVMTARMKAAGCIVIGKTNMPEFGLGSHTFNTLFGTTRNAYAPSLSAGGSSGGAAVALAQRLLPVADGSDFMGSLRNPAGWNNIFGMRPSQGRVPFLPTGDVWISQLGTEGPMARTVKDLARLLSTQASYDARSPLSVAQTPQDFAALGGFAQRPSSCKGLKVGWLGDLGGHLAFEPGILPACEQALSRMERDGAIIVPTELGFDAAALWDAWLAWRRALVGPRVAPLLKQPGAREQIKADALWEHDQALSLTAMELLDASAVRTAFLHRMIALFDQVDVLALPTAQVWPFAVEQLWPKQINGRTMDTYHRWMEATIYATFAGLPAISVPAGFDVTGRMPVGLQLIGKPLGDAALLAVAASYETLIDDWLARKP